MKYRSSTLEALHKLSSRHREMVEAAARCGCFYCGAVFAPGEIPEWWDEPGCPECTAVCPRCFIDSVLPEGPDTPLDGDLLVAMHAYWFGPDFMLPWTLLLWRVKWRLQAGAHRVAWDLGVIRRGRPFPQVSTRDKG